ncbi:serine hydrolase [Kaistia dalseonensis]|uniref:CubicO group peptidase (Beta-lactamase class C family) n=1 Tax=Kaistia dalseonensis TaxID=410840 RepID=A0ABU0HD73_9HYPH|nr:serine hydrolase domain-containing protein [Kaistia dalseonensis]MCX5497624.1 serine hydrolase [Kaistia dalseonensis]MDQ0440266.1 CubicO group peptidase (beta-lactamase class C family) [Kaistia dalseonensis]
MTAASTIPFAEQDARAARLDAVIDAAIAEERIVGTVVMVAENGEIVYRRAAGHADREAGRLVTEDTIFRLASVTKPMVAVATLALVDAGKIALDDPVTKYLPQFRPRLIDGTEPVITIRHLLSHTSGLQYGYDAGADISEGLSMPGRGMAENLEKIAAVPLMFAPGTSWRYSVAIDVLGGLLEQAIGKTLPDIVAEQVTRPLGLADTAFSVTALDRLATAYADGKPRPTPMTEPQRVEGKDGALIFSPGRLFDPTSFPSGGAGMAGSAPDFLRFLETIRKGGAPIVSLSGVKLLSENAIGTFDTGVPGRGFSLGWSITIDPAASQSPFSPGSWQWGGVYGHSWFVDPARKLSVVGFSNTAVAGVNGAYPDAIRAAVYG